ncbi:hypothetical protein C5N14_09755 [Micromonospora sp. MW-13]|nr:hypothetical protein C5N14_09755 [Micromonospora sp. MW-13]
MIDSFVRRMIEYPIGRGGTATVDALVASDADLIALQEVNPRGHRRVPLVRSAAPGGAVQRPPFSAGVTVSRWRVLSPLENGQSRSACSTNWASCCRLSPADEMEARTSAR